MVYPDAYNTMLALSQALMDTGLAPLLIDLVNHRISQLKWLCILVWNRLKQPFRFVLKQRPFASTRGENEDDF
jgi:hypothetical protein